MKSRRSFLKSLGNVFGLILMPFSVTSAGNYRFNIVGGGVAGTRVAAYLKMSLPSATVTLFDPSLKSFSGSVYSAIQNNYKPVGKDVLDAIGVDTIIEKAVVLEPEERSVILASGKKHKADFLIIAPGIDFKWPDIKGYIARQAGLNVNSDWRQVNSNALESIHHKHVYVIGDANDADFFNKTAVVADQQALQCVSKIKSIIG